MIRVALVGLGKMGLSHYAIVNAHPAATLVAVCDSARYVLDVLNKYTGIKCYTDFEKMLASEPLDALFIATPSSTHGPMVRMALERNLHVFCEKPFCLDLALGRELVHLAESRARVNQVGYHNRFIASFVEARRLLAAGVLGEIHNAKAESYGPVVLKPKGQTWRTRRAEGGGCLYDYASHGIDLLNYMIGPPARVGGSALGHIFSPDVEDQVHSTLFYEDGLSAQLAANWSDDSFRKMSTKISIWGRNGRIIADRQELQIYLRTPSAAASTLTVGWNQRYTTDMTRCEWFYLRGEEYSAQVDHFFACIKDGQAATRSSFRSALETDTVASMILRDASGLAAPAAQPPGRWGHAVRKLCSTLRS